MKLLKDILKNAIEKEASDIHLTQNSVPVYRILGKLVFNTEYSVLTKEILADIICGLITEDQKKIYEKRKYIDTTLEESGCRFRVHIYRQRNVDTVAIRIIPWEIPELNSLKLPDVVHKLTEIKNGIILITGTTGSGKSTTLAAIVDNINVNQSKHIMTIEDPVEFVHQHKLSIVNQKEIGVDVLNYADAVRSAMREDPDILVLGEMRDLETITNALTMAETGHLVLATLHTKNAAETVDRIIDVFPPEQQTQIRVQLANALRAIVSQQLIPSLDGKRVPACEILIMNDAIKANIKDGGHANNINDAMHMNHKKIGSQTIYQSLANLYKDGLIDEEIALSCVDNPNQLRNMIMG